ncbi:hypothetical protein FPV67DRAFT_1420405, partial [Lyophyllum atratum]
VENTTYNLHLGILKTLSQVFADILSIPSDTPQGTEAFPVVLEQVSTAEFDDLLYWVYKTQWTPPPHPERVLLNLLKLSQRWIIDAGTAYAARLGFRVYVILAKAKEAMEVERRKVAAVPPSVPAFPSWNVKCESHARCRSTWKDVWMKKIAKEILHPTQALQFEVGVLVELIERTEFPGMSTGCKEEMVGIIRDVGLYNTLVIDKAAEDIINYYKSLE